MLGFPPTSSTCRSKKPDPGPPLWKTCGNCVASLADPVGFAPVDLVQELIVDPRSGVVGELSLDKVTEHGFAFLDLDVTDRSAEVIRFANP